MRIETSRTLLLLVSVAFFAAVSKAAEFDDINEEELRLLDDEKFTPEEKRAAFVGMRGGYLRLFNHDVTKQLAQCTYSKVSI